MRYFLTLLTLIACTANAADNENLLIGGTQVSELNSYSYLGVLKPFEGYKIGDGWYSNLIASWLTYEYDTFANNRDVTAKATAPGINIGIGYSWTKPKYNLSLGLSAGYRHINMSPHLPDEDPQGDVFTMTPDIQARYKFSDYVDADLISSYAFGQKALFNRVRLGLHPTAKWRVGVEAFLQKGQNYKSHQFGVFGSSYFSNGLGYELSAGYSENDDGATSPYIGINFAKFF